MCSPIDGLTIKAASPSYTYNGRNRLAQAAVGALAWGYTYNALEQLSLRSRVGASPAEITHYIHDLSGNVIAEADGSTGGTVREYIWLPEAEIAPTAGSRTNVDRPVAVVDGVNTASPAIYYVHVDHLHRPIKMTDGAKANVWAAVWQAWGGVHSISGTQSLDARFPGQWFQAETGLHYNWHRHYDPTIGRYTQPDPLGFVDGPSVYGYARGAPNENVDPTGEWTPIRVIIATGGAGISACMKLPRCRDAIQKIKDMCSDLRCEVKRERADHNFGTAAKPSFCEHYRITCWRKSGRILDQQVAIPGRCFDSKQTELGAGGANPP